MGSTAVVSSHCVFREFRSPRFFSLGAPACKVKSNRPLPCLIFCNVELSHFCATTIHSDGGRKLKWQRRGDLFGLLYLELIESVFELRIIFFYERLDSLSFVPSLPPNNNINVARYINGILVDYTAISISYLFTR